MGTLVADIAVETLQNAGGKHRYCVVDEPGIGMARYAAAPIARLWRGRLGNGEGEFPLVEASSSSVNSRCGGVAHVIDLPRNMSVVKHRGSHRLCP